MRWLRYECGCEDCGESSTGIRFVTLLDLSKELSIRRCGFDDDGDLAVTWGPDEHHSRYERAWLRRHCLAPESRAARMHSPTTWGRELIERLPQVSFEDYENDVSRRCDAFEAIRDYGLVHIVDGPAETGTTERLALKIGPLEDNNFGQVFDIRSDPDSYTIGATNHPVTLHTDNSFRNMPTGIIALQCRGAES